MSHMMAKLFDWNGMLLTDGQIFDAVLTLPGLVPNTSNLYIAGEITLIPEPARCCWGWVAWRFGGEVGRGAVWAFQIKSCRKFEKIGKFLLILPDDGL